MADSRFARVTDRVDWFTPDDRTDRPSLGAVRGATGTLLVETGASPGHLSAFLEELESRGAPPVVEAVLTHWHWDHSFGSQVLDVPVAAHVDTTRELAVQAAYGFSDAELDQRVDDGREIQFCSQMIRLEMPDRSGLRVVVPQRQFAARHEVDLGGVRAVAVHVGGDHSADSCVVHVPGDDILFLGDCWYQRLHAPRPCLTIAGIRALVDRLRAFPVRIAIEGHGDDPLDAAAFEARLEELVLAAELVEDHGARAASQAPDEDLAEVVAFLLEGEGLLAAER